MLLNIHAHGPWGMQLCRYMYTWGIQLCSVYTCTCVHMEHTCIELNVLFGVSYMYVIVAYHRKCCGGGLGTVCL